MKPQFCSNFPMNTILTIDNGNTSPSVGTFDSTGILIDVFPLIPFLTSHDLVEHKIILSDVGRNIPQLKDHPRTLCVGSLKKKNSFLEMPVHYSSTLGEDRLISAYHIYKKGYGRSVVIDAGTFTTIDLVDQNGFRGGYIFPGLQTFLNSYTSAANLPQLNSEKISQHVSNGIPQDTPEALLTSCHLYCAGIFKEVLSSLSPIPQLFLTGGESTQLLPILKEFLPSDTALTYHPYLVHQALYDLHEH